MMRAHLLSVLARAEVRICWFEDASHWLQHDKGHDVTQMILGFVTE